MELDQILNGESKMEESTGEEVEAKSEEPKEEPKKAEEPKDDKVESTPDSKDDDWRYHAYKDEKRKRQELEKKISELEKPKEKAPDVFENQDAYTNYISSQIDESTLRMQTSMSLFMAEREFGKEEVDRKTEIFRELVESDPGLRSEVLNSISPYHTVIDIVDKHEKLNELKNVDAMEAKIRGELEAKIRKELEDEMSSKQSKRESVTPSLNNSASVTGSANKDEDDLLGILGR